jgi:DNA-binding MarR family transcriptional regulator
MPGRKPSQLTAADRILLHLREYWLASSRLEFPSNITQKGIATATGLVLTHVPRALKRLRADGLIREVSGHIEGERRRYKAYFLTDEGMRSATSMRQELLESRLTLRRGGKEWDGKLSEALQLSPELGIIGVIRCIGEDGVLDLGAAGKAEQAAPPRHELDEAPPMAEFLDREEESRHLEALHEGGRCRAMIIIGGLGIGKSALARKFVESVMCREAVAWLNLHRAITPERVFERVASFLGGAEGCPAGLEASGRRLARMLNEGAGLVVLDDYFEVPEATVEFFQALFAELRPGLGARILLTLREDTPSYNRFYGRREVESGAVEELHLRGLGPEDSRQLLGARDIDRDAMKRIYLLTKGSPQTLKLLAAGDVERLRQTTRFTNEEIRLLLFLKTVKAPKG